jgi:hypothetical protein
VATGTKKKIQRPETFKSVPGPPIISLFWEDASGGKSGRDGFGKKGRARDEINDIRQVRFI